MMSVGIRQRNLLLSGIACFIAVGAYLLFWHSEQPIDASELRLDRQAQSSDETAQSGHDLADGFAPLGDSAVIENPAIRPIPSHLLPGATKPFAEQLPLLVARAEQGDGVAACRLVFGANRCIARAYVQRSMDRQARSLESDGDSSDARTGAAAFAAGRDSVDVTPGFCDGLDLAKLPNTEVLLAKSLSALTPKQKTMLALMLPGGQVRRLTVRFAPANANEYLLPQLIGDHTVEFLQSGFAAREPLALEGLILLHAPSYMVRAQGVMPRLPHHRKFLAYASLQRRLFGPEALGREANWILELVTRSTPPGILDQLNADVEAEAQRWAQGRGIGRLAPGKTLPQMQDIEDPVSACDG